MHPHRRPKGPQNSNIVLITTVAFLVDLKKRLGVVFVNEKFLNKQCMTVTTDLLFLPVYAPVICSLDSTLNNAWLSKFYFPKLKCTIMCKQHNSEVLNRTAMFIVAPNKCCRIYTSYYQSIVNVDQ